MATLIFSVIGILSTQWLYFIILAIFNVISVLLLNDKNNLSIVKDGQEVSLTNNSLNFKIKLVKVFNFILIFFLVLNHFHLHYNLSELIINLF